MSRQLPWELVLANVVLAVVPAKIIYFTGGTVEYAVLTSVYVMVFSMMMRQSATDPQE